MKFGKLVVKFHIPILIAALVLLIPSVIGMQATRINYDMLNYLPDGHGHGHRPEYLCWKILARVLFLYHCGKHAGQRCHFAEGKDCSRAPCGDRTVV